MTVSGKIIIGHKRYPERHEFKTAEILVQQGVDVIFLPEGRAKGVKSADVEINGVLWEIKSPIGDGRHTIERQFKRATKQSPNIIIDLRRCQLRTQIALTKIKKEWINRRNIKRLKIINKDGELLDYKR